MLCPPRPRSFACGEAGGLTVLVVPLESLRVDQVRKANALAEKLQWKAGQLSFALSSATVAGRNDACRRAGWH